MKIRYQIIVTIGIIIFSLLSVVPGYAQSTSPLTASVDRDTLSAGETLNLKITISGNYLKAPEPEMPSLEGFETTGTSTSSQISIINGDMKVTTTHIYRLRPTNIGDLTIGSIRVTIDGQTYETSPINVHVTQPEGIDQSTPEAGEQNPASPTELVGQDFFVKAEVNKQEVFQGEQLTYTFYFFHAVEIYDQPYYSSPSFTGFWSESQSDSNTYQTVVSNRVYNVNELTTILFPTTSGEISIEAAELTIPASFFNAQVDLQTQPIEIHVKSLPEGAPENFNGAIGQFSISQEIDSPTGKVNEPLTQKVIVQGSGNINNLPDPQWQDIEGWRTFDSQATTNSFIENGVVQGSHVYERLLVPSKEGTFTLPPVEYSYFDPALGEYQTITTAAMDVTIEAASPDTTPVITGNQKEIVEQIGSDIRYLKPSDADFSGSRSSLADHTLFWLAWLLPLFVLGGNFVWQKRQQDLQNNLSLVRSSKARRKARNAISEAGKNKVDVYQAGNRILLNYLSDKLNQPVAGLTHNALSTLLSEKGLSKELIDGVLEFLSTGDMGRYAPGSSPSLAASILPNASSLIDRLEKEL